jgi:hypothetical protein
MAADDEGEEPKQVEHKGDHEPRLWPDGTDRSTTWLRDEVLARDRLPGDVRDSVQGHVRAGYLAGLSDGPRSFAIIVRAVRGLVPR